MTTTNTNDQILDDSAVSEIEAGLSKLKVGYVTLPVNLASALCATVKHLREVNQGIIDGIADGKKLLHDQISDLQSQLEQLRAENGTLQEKLKRKSRELISLKGRCHE